MKDYRFVYTDLTNEDIIKETIKPKPEVFGNLNEENITTLQIIMQNKTNQN